MTENLVAVSHDRAVTPRGAKFSRRHTANKSPRPNTRGDISDSIRCSTCTPPGSGLQGFFVLKSLSVCLVLAFLQRQWMQIKCQLRGSLSHCLPLYKDLEFDIWVPIGLKDSVLMRRGPLKSGNPSLKRQRVISHHPHVDFRPCFSFVYLTAHNWAWLAHSGLMNSETAP